MKCLNTSLPAVKESLAVIKSEPMVAKLIDQLGSTATAKDIIREYQKQVDYKFKGVTTIQNNLEKIRKWESNKSIDQNTLWNKIQELGVSKDQLELIKAANGTTVEDKVLSFMSDYSYTIEINTAMNTSVQMSNNDVIKDEKNGMTYVKLVPGSYLDKSYANGTTKEVTYIKYNTSTRSNFVQISEKEFNDKLYSKPSQIYSNVTVPGGTSYVENEIATPAITPSIKGHAQFATNKGIGWFRSDEQSIDQHELMRNMKTEKVDDITKYYIYGQEVSYEKYRKILDGKIDNSIKTRRILEVQSDYFQKLRNNFNHQGFKYEIINTAEGKKYKKIGEKGSNWTLTFKEYNEVFEDFIDKGGDNQFLALLHKGDNWVTFFVKSIIQDSAKKEYEKVLFPSGDTASKVEGHTTLEEFKREKENRLKQLEKIKIERKKAIDEFNNGKKTREKVEGKDGYFINVEKLNGASWSIYVENKIEEEIAIQKELSSLNSSYDEPDTEISQLKQELERVDKEGFGAFKPIYNFYENTIANILKKQGYNSKQVTDEYGNTWNEVQLSSQSSEKIYFQTENNSEQPSNKELDQKIRNFLDRIGVSVEKVSQIRDFNGQPLSAIAKADMLNRIIQVIDERADLSTLPEEAAHFFVEMLGDDSPLLKEMMDKITGYELYKQVVEKYKGRPEYRLPGGGINFPKIKKEAIGQLIAQAIIRQEQGAETQERVKFLMGWWQKLWKMLSKIFARVEENPFEAVAQQILSANTENLQTNKKMDGVYYQLDDSISKLKAEQAQLTLDNSIDVRTGQKRHVYRRNNKAVKLNVTTAKVDPYYKSIFPNDKRDDIKKKLGLLKAEYGDMIHATMENIIDVYIDPVTNKRRVTPAVSKSIHQGTDFYNILDAYVQELIGTYDADTVFMKEVKVYDSIQDMAGSIDLIAITPDGTVNVYDWKSQEIGKDKNELPSYKEKAYRIQLQEYVNILRNMYGFEKFGKVRAIPIKTNFKYEGLVGAKQLTGLNSVEIAPVDTRFTDPDKDYLLPVTLKEDKNDDENLGKIIQNLSNLLERFETLAKKSKVSERMKMQEQISSYRKAIRDLHLRKDIRKFIELGMFEVNRYQKKIIDKTVSEKDALESLDILNVFSGTTYFFKNYMGELRSAMNAEQDPNIKKIYQDIINNYNSLNSNADNIVKEMEAAVLEVGENIAKKKANVTNLLDSEIQIGRVQGLFDSLSQLPQRAFKVFYRILSDAQNKRDNLHRESVKILTGVKEEMEKWAKSRGLSNANMFNDILQIDDKGNWNGDFLRKYLKDAYSKRKQAIEAQDINWLNSNMTFDDTWYDRDLLSYIKYVNGMSYNIDPAINSALQQQKINSWIANHNVNAGGTNSMAWLNTQNKYLRFNDNWITDKWKNMQKPENAPLKKMYEEFQKLLRKSEDLGMIDEYSTEFIPSIYKGKIDQMVFGGDVFSSKGIFDDLQVSVGDRYTPEIDPINGKVISTIPVHFTKDIGVEKEDGSVDYSQKSRDLFKIFTIWSAQMASYETMSEIEDAANVLAYVEKKKDSLVVDNWGNVVIEDGLAKETRGNETNAKLLETFVNFYLYNKMSDNATDKKIPINGKEYSMNKTGRWFMKFFSLKTLALNPISGTAQFVGGTGNALFLAAKKTIFTTKDWTNAMYQVTKRDPKTIALLHYADILLEDRKDAIAQEMSVSKIVNFNSMDKLYFIQRGSDKAVQYPVAIATMMNHMVDVNGKIVDITKTVKQEFNYDSTYYIVSEEEREILKKKIDARVKELKDTKSIYATTKIVNDKLEVPGIKIESQEWSMFRAKIKQVNKTILGNSTHDDINSIRTSQIGMAFMQFRSWMPQMVKERFGKLNYNQDLDMYTMGKTRLFFSELLKHPMTIAQSIIKRSGTNMITAAKQRYIIERANAALEGRDFTLTEAEFIDLYIGNIRSELRELLVIIGMFALIFMVKPGADDDDDEQKGMRKYITRAMSKYFAEFNFYYSPESFTDLVQSPLPVIGLANDFQYFIRATAKQFYGVVTDDDKLQDKAKPMKYASRLIPILKEGILMKAIFDDDFRKEWDIRL